MKSLVQALRFARHWSAPRKDLLETELILPSGGDGAGVPASLLTPPGTRPRTGWVVLHGITRPGRRHPGLLRFARALASTGGRVLVPEIPPWTRLRFDPHPAQEVLARAVRVLADSAETATGGVVLAGFSFGGPQALLAASGTKLAPHLKGVVSWGGYGSLHRAVDFQFSGEHRWEDRKETLRPDPYGRWVLGANYLTLVPGLEDREELASALHRLAAEAGDRQVPALGPELDPLKLELRRKLAPRDRDLFDLFAPPWDQDPDPEAGRELGRAIAEVARRETPLLDPVPGMGEIGPGVRLLHGRSDRLIPYTETLHLEEALKDRTRDLDTGITGLFAHSGQEGGGGLISRVREGANFIRVLRSVFDLDRQT
jgi:dienelactone hydrolase